jgi:hypothetical protein
MTVHLEIPDDVAQRLSAAGKDLPRVAFELILAEAYREEILTHEEVRQAMGYQTPMEVDGFLKKHQVWLEYTVEDFEREIEGSRQARERRRQELAREAAQQHRRAG